KGTRAIADRGVRTGYGPRMGGARTSAGATDPARRRPVSGELLDQQEREVPGGLPSSRVGHARQQRKHRKPCRCGQNVGEQEAQGQACEFHREAAKLRYPPQQLRRQVAADEKKYGGSEPVG